MALWFYYGVLSFSLLFVLVFFSVLFSNVISSLGEERTGLCASCAFACLFCTCLSFIFFSSSWCQGLAAACECGIPWTFLLILYTKKGPSIVQPGILPTGMHSYPAGPDLPALCLRASLSLLFCVSDFLWCFIVQLEIKLKQWRHSPNQMTFPYTPCIFASVVGILSPDWETLQENLRVAIFHFRCMLMHSAWKFIE